MKKNERLPWISGDNPPVPVEDLDTITDIMSPKIYLGLPYGGSDDAILATFREGKFRTYIFGQYVAIRLEFYLEIGSAGR